MTILSMGCSRKVLVSHNDGIGGPGLVIESCDRLYHSA